MMKIYITVSCFNQIKEVLYVNNPKKKKRFILLLDDWNALKKNPLTMIGIVSMLIFIYFLVYITGGIKYVYSHTMYIPIILAGIFYGPTFGGLIAFFAAILLGPLMPIDTTTGEMQLVINWLYRMLIFIVVGTIIGYASNRLRQDAKHIEELMSTNQETNVPNTNYLRNICKTLNYNSYSVFTVLITNHHSIIDILGVDIYHELIYQMYCDFKDGLPRDSKIIQSDSNKLWILIPNGDINLDVQVLINLLNQPRQIQNVPLYVDCSIGGSLCYMLDDCHTLRLFEESDLSAREAQINNLPYVLGDKNKSKKRAEYDLLATFTKALSNQETYLVFQPKVDLKTMKPYGLEALIRWNHPIRGNIPPLVFVPLVEETKLIHLLTDWVLINTLKKCRELIDLGFLIPISLNISGKNLYDPQFYNRCIQIIEESSVPYEYIEFELTESTLMINPTESKIILQKFSDLGIKISLDDFGSGYSSLAYLTQFPLDFIKIDRYFLKEIMNNGAMQSIVKSTITLSKNLGYKVVVEGVETKEVVDLVASFECDYAQGYHFAKPMSSVETTEWIKKSLK